MPAILESLDVCNFPTVPTVTTAPEAAGAESCPVGDADSALGTRATKTDAQIIREKDNEIAALRASLVRTESRMKYNSNRVDDAWERIKFVECQLADARLANEMLTHRVNELTAAIRTAQAALAAAAEEAPTPVAKVVEPLACYSCGKPGTFVDGVQVAVCKDCIPF